jgi:hypothetical protein
VRQDLGQLVPGARGQSSLQNSQQSSLSISNGINRQSTIAGDDFTVDELDEEERLPQGWEQRIDANGRVLEADEVLLKN